MKIVRLAITLIIISFLSIIIFLPFYAFGKSISALIVGIERYKNFPTLPGPLNDILTIKKVLNRIYKNDTLKVEILSNKEATKDKIISFLMSMKNEKDTVVFYFSGHGSRIIDRNNDEKDGLDEVLCPYDFSNSSPIIASKTSLVDDTLEEIISSWNAKKKIVIIDACHSGTVYKDTDGSIAKFIPQRFYMRSIMEGEPLFSENEKKTTGLIFISASKDKEKAKSVKINHTYHGALTYLLDKGITPLGDKNKDGKLTWRELKEFVVTHMSLSPVRSSQHPEFFFDDKDMEKDTIIVFSHDTTKVSILPKKILKPGEPYKISFYLPERTIISIKEKNPKGEVESIYPIKGINYTYKPLGPGKIVLPIKGHIVNIEFFAGDLPGKYEIIILTKNGRELIGEYEVR